MSGMDVEFIDHLGSDLTVVNAARVSFDKESEWHLLWGQGGTGPAAKILHSRDEKLIQYLAKHDHWTPFGHCSATFRIKAPIFVARQLGKHQVGLVWNEVSRRYVDSEPEFYFPDQWRKRAENVKQGSSDEVYRDFLCIPGSPSHMLTPESVMDSAVAMYNYMVEVGICPEQARMVLPQSMMTEWYWTGTLAAWARVCRLRLDSHAQRETQEIARKISDHMKELFPVSWEALMGVRKCI